MKYFFACITGINFFLFVFMLLLFGFHTSLDVTSWVGLTGKWHPLILHLPIGGVCMLVVIALLRGSIDLESYLTIQKNLYSVTAFAALLSAITGIILAAEPGSYPGEEISWHRNSGVLLAAAMYISSSFKAYLNAIYERVALGIMCVVMIFTGHQGATITHGSNFLFPVNQEDTISVNADWQSQPLFNAAVLPLMKEKCASCHNPKKSKGDLVVTDGISLLRGGKSGKAIVPSDLSGSLLWQRLLLPSSDEKHMPPQEKVQLTRDEVRLIRLWIQSGASITKVYDDYEESDSFRLVVNDYLEKTGSLNKKYRFNFVASEVIERLNNPYVHVKPLYAGSPAFSASFFVASSYQSGNLYNLKEIKDQLVSLNLSGMPIQKSDLEMVASFQNIEKLQLNQTGVTDQDLVSLKTLKNLSHLSLLNTKVTAGVRFLFESLYNLKNVYVYSDKLSPDTINAWQRDFPNIRFVSGVQMNEKIKLSPPLLVNQDAVLPQGDSVKLMHHIKDVKILFTTDGSIPDTTSGQIYRAPIDVKHSVDVTVRAVKSGWLASDPQKYTLYKRGITPVKTQFLSAPSTQYPGLGEKTFSNGVLGPVNNVRDANWIAYREEPCRIVFDFGKSEDIKSISLSYARHIPQYIFPPTQIKVYGGNNLAELKLMKTQDLDKVLSNDKDQVSSGVVHLQISGNAVKYIKVEAFNLPVIPRWHPGKGEKGWLFIDEIFFYK